MKTQTSNLKKMAASICLALVLSSASFANAHKSDNAEARLDAFMDRTAASLQYVAPAAEVTEEYTSALYRLDAMAESTEASVKYQAPEAIETAPEFERLDAMALTAEAAVRYNAPLAVEVAPEIERLDNLAAATEASLAFRAPQAEDDANTEVTNTNDYVLASEF